MACANAWHPCDLGGSSDGGRPVARHQTTRCDCFQFRIGAIRPMTNSHIPAAAEVRHCLRFVARVAHANYAALCVCRDPVQAFRLQPRRESNTTIKRVCLKNPNGKGITIQTAAVARIKIVIANRALSGAHVLFWSCVSVWNCLAIGRRLAPFTSEFGSAPFLRPAALITTTDVSSAAAKSSNLRVARPGVRSSQSSPIASHLSPVR